MARTKTIDDISKHMSDLGVKLGVEEIIGGILLTEWVAEQGACSGTFGRITDMGLVSHQSEGREM